MGFTHYDKLSTYGKVFAFGKKGEEAAFMSGDVTSGTTRSKVKLTPAASAAITGISYHNLVTIGDETGTTDYGMGDPTIPTTGLMASFGRTTVATANIADTAAEFRILNRVVNTGANIIQGAYIKAKNYVGGTVGMVRGLFVEAVNDGTATSVFPLELGSDGTVPTANIKFTNGLYFVALTTAITATSTTTSAPIGSIGITSHATGRGKLFMANGTVWVYAGAV